MSQPPITKQPGLALKPIAYSEIRGYPFNEWAATPAPTTTGFSPPLHGLELLRFLDALAVDQAVQKLGTVTDSWSRKNYIICNAENQICYRVVEDSTTPMGCLPPQREFVMHIHDINGKEVLTAHRISKSCMGCICSDCCADSSQQIEISSGGQLLGTVVEIPLCGKNQFEIKDAGGKPIALLVAPSCLPCNCEQTCGKDIFFRVLAIDTNQEVGLIARRYFGIRAHSATVADSFVVKYEKSGMDVKLKALILGAVFLIDFRWFERGRKKYKAMPTFL